MRNAFASEVEKVADQRSDLVLVTADIGNRLFDNFKAKFPQRFYNCGVAEACMTGVAAGMASLGLKTFTYTITPFATTRCLEQIRVDLCYHQLPVVVCGVGSGYGYGALGATHHACEDISFLRSLPEMAVCCPGDPWEVRAAVRAAADWKTPLYLRMGKKGEPAVHPGLPADFRIGKALTVRPGTRVPPAGGGGGGTGVALLSTGTVLPIVMETAERLQESGISAEVVSFHTVKPLDEEFLQAALKRFGLLVSVEEHSLIGGLGSALAEWMCDQGPCPTRLLRVGTPDRFVKECGEQHYLQQQAGLTAEAISERIRQALCT